MRADAHNIPFAPARLPFYYGWVVLVAGTVGVVLSAPAQTIGVSAFIPSLIVDTVLTRTSVSTAYGLGTLCGAFLLTPAGRLYDRIGARRAALIAVYGMAIALFLLSQLPRLSAFGVRMAPFLSEHAVTFGVASTCFFLLRFLGQGMLTMVSRNMVMKWWVSRAGLANGLIGVLVGLGFAMVPPLFNGRIVAWGWQASWRNLALLAAGGFALFIFVFFRDNPASCGMQPDPAARWGGLRGRRHAPARDFSLGEALASRTYWLYTLALSLQAFYGTAFAFHVASIFEQAGLSAQVAYRVFLPAAAVSVSLGLFAGWVSDHIHLKHLLRVQLLGLAISMTGLILNAGWLTWGLAVAGNGLSLGMFGVLLGMTWPRFFGLRHVGAISGSHLTVSVLFSALGPAFYAFVLGRMGSYLWANVLCLCIVGVLFVASWWRRGGGE